MIKIYILATHHTEQIKVYGIVEVFSEDSLELIHAIVNSVARIYAMIPPKERAG